MHLTTLNVFKLLRWKLFINTFVHSFNLIRGQRRVDPNEKAMNNGLQHNAAYILLDWEIIYSSIQFVVNPRVDPDKKASRYQNN